jgi:aubergine-like protein
MFDQPALKVWGIFYSDRDAGISKQFASTMEECLRQFGYESCAPALFPVKGIQPDAWRRELQSKLNNNV